MTSVISIIRMKGVNQQADRFNTGITKGTVL